MKQFVRAMEGPTGEIARIGDADDGWALFFEGDRARWIDRVYGNSTIAPEPGSMLFANSGFVRIVQGASVALTRAGVFGMGGDGSASHAHDDLLSPILWLGGLPVLVDPGTYVYNGNPIERARYRDRQAHNTLVIGQTTGAVQHLNFGWEKTRPAARIVSYEPDAVTMEFGEWKGQHTRRIELAEGTCRIKDDFPRSLAVAGGAKWHLHLHPDWQLKSLDELQAEFRLRSDDIDGITLLVTFSGRFTELKSEEYPFSVSYLVKRTGWNLQARAEQLKESFAIALSIVDGNKQAARGVRPASSEAIR